ncbi:dipeptide/oligopeptide/nickel ABC transporter permease/ATP-binding protein [Microbacterium sp. ANT_H45B]|uniref:dipeptide/oligopeptide/nickel ABC transporter permease/ATP-binding protein n=1 Tax=Microbacterium TaxID=33882 RepID=UPI0011EC1913|nr:MULTISPECIES: dipeptide/oligopeptide/nickel ABC transporter permease/ATP-binding protein [Microbacterium]KAA0960013.1 dipeptide/oligopeptide/nickel ABC transporter permease/ATP-binding protein [Microbacterium sp. ANT_H45B]
MTTLPPPIPASAASSSSRHALVTVLRSPLGIAASLLLVTLILLAALGPVIWGETAKIADLTQLSMAPSEAHLLGTDAGGRDVLARLLSATRISVVTAVLATAIGVTLGVLLGLLPTVAPNWVARVVNSILGVALAFPSLLLAIVVSIVVGVGVVSVTLAIGLAMAPAYARLAQTLGASAAGRDYVDAARILGVSRFRILTRHVLPNVRDPLIVNASIGAGTALVASTGLSFLGLGVQAPDYDWGRMLNESLDGIFVNAAPTLGLSAAIVFAGVTFALVGETLARAFGLNRSPRRQRRRRGTATNDVAPLHVVDDPVLRVRDLRVRVPRGDGWADPVRGVSFDVGRGEIVGVVGESGSGKSLTCMAVAALLEEPIDVVASTVQFEGTELTAGGRVSSRIASAGVAHQLGARMAFVFQDPATSLNPALHVGTQVAEVGVLHGGLDRSSALRRAIDRLDAVRIPDAVERAQAYPHEFSGGMRQRAMIAMGVMGEPALLIADEPTTALDVTVQREVMSLLAEVNEAKGTALLFVSHDIALVSSFCTRVLVMYRGAIVEDLAAADLAAGRARHPYTRALVEAIPHLEAEPGAAFATIAEDAEFPTEPVGSRS